jgi:hypothetical protein
MDIKEAIKVIQDYSNQWGINGVLETAMEMNREFDTLSFEQETALIKFMSVGREFFAEVE